MCIMFVNVDVVLDGHVCVMYVNVCVCVCVCGLCKCVCVCVCVKSILDSCMNGLMMMIG